VSYIIDMKFPTTLSLQLFLIINEMLLNMLIRWNEKAVIKVDFIFERSFSKGW